MVESLRSDPEANLESVQKFFVDVTSAYPFDSAFIKNIVLSGGGLLLRTIQSLLGSPSTADAAVRMLDSVRRSCPFSLLIINKLKGCISHCGEEYRRR